MNCRTLFLILIALDLTYDVILRILAASRRGLPLPEAVRDLYDADDYARWLDYSAEKRRLGLIEKVFDALILTALFASNVFAAVWNRLPVPVWSSSMRTRTASSRSPTSCTRSSLYR